MAKLSARGRTELASATCVERDDVSGHSVRRERRVMSDGKILNKTTWLHSTGRVDFATGWKTFGALRGGACSDAITNWCTAYRNAGWDVRRVAP